MPNNILHYFHKSQMEKIKKEVKGVTYIAHENHKGAYFIKVSVKNEKGGKDHLTFPLQTTPDRLTTKEYNFILETLKSGDYGN